MNPTVFTGVIRGRIIELDTDPGLAEGQSVVVIIHEPRGSIDGLRAAFGGWSDDPEGLDRYLEWNRQQRQSDSREVEP